MLDVLRRNVRRMRDKKLDLRINKSLTPGERLYERIEKVVDKIFHELPKHADLDDLWLEDIVYGVSFPGRKEYFYEMDRLDDIVFFLLVYMLYEKIVAEGRSVFSDGDYITILSKMRKFIYDDEVPLLNHVATGIRVLLRNNMLDLRGDGYVYISPENYKFIMSFLPESIREKYRDAFNRVFESLKRYDEWKIPVDDIILISSYIGVLLSKFFDGSSKNIIGKRGNNIVMFIENGSHSIDFEVPQLFSSPDELKQFINELLENGYFLFSDKTFILNVGLDKDLAKKLYNVLLLASNIDGKVINVVEKLKKLARERLKEELKNFVESFGSEYKFEYRGEAIINALEYVCFNVVNEKSLRKTGSCVHTTYPLFHTMMELAGTTDIDEWVRKNLKTLAENKDVSLADNTEKQLIKEIVERTVEKMKEQVKPDILFFVSLDNN